MVSNFESFNTVTLRERAETRAFGAQQQAQALFQERQIAGTFPRQPDTDQSGHLDFGNIYVQMGISDCTRPPKGQRENAGFKPDYERKSQSARDWTEKAKSLDGKSLVTDCGGKYTVQPGDSLEGIARRLLKKEGNGNPTNRDVLSRINSVVEANKHLGGNRNWLKAGSEIVIPGETKGTGTTPVRLDAGDVPKSSEAVKNRYVEEAITNLRKARSESDLERSVARLGSKDLSAEAQRPIASVQLRSS